MVILGDIGALITAEKKRTKILRFSAPRGYIQSKENQ
jgi:hypothetical protein